MTARTRPPVDVRSRRPAPRRASTAGDRLDLAGLVGAFGQLLHAAGVPVTPERSGRFARAVVLARPATTDELYWAGRVTLLSGHDQIEVFDRVFAQVFRGVVDVADARGDPNAPELPPPASRPGPGATARAPAAAPGGELRATGARRARRARPTRASRRPSWPPPAPRSGSARRTSRRSTA